MDGLLRAFVLLMVCCKYIEETGAYPTQALLCKKVGDQYSGLLNIFWSDFGLVHYNPFAFSGAPHINSAAALLAEKNLMLPRGSWQNKKNYVPADCGWKFYRKISPLLHSNLSPKEIVLWISQIDC